MGTTFSDLDIFLFSFSYKKKITTFSPIAGLKNGYKTSEFSSLEGKSQNETLRQIATLKSEILELGS